MILQTNKDIRYVCFYETNVRLGIDSTRTRKSQIIRAVVYLPVIILPNEDNSEFYGLTVVTPGVFMQYMIKKYTHPTWIQNSLELNSIYEHQLVSWELYER